jgi:3-hydroxyisobutyrate dehydrogenase-like beta-hydroxyacid dehydrogenase
MAMAHEAGALGWELVAVDGTSAAPQERRALEAKLRELRQRVLDAPA